MSFTINKTSFSFIYLSSHKTQDLSCYLLAVIKKQKLFFFLYHGDCSKFSTGEVLGWIVDVYFIPSVGKVKEKFINELV